MASWVKSAARKAALGLLRRFGGEGAAWAEPAERSFAEKEGFGAGRREEKVLSGRRAELEACMALSGCAWPLWAQKAAAMALLGRGAKEFRKLRGEGMFPPAALAAMRAEVYWRECLRLGCRRAARRCPGFGPAGPMFLAGEGWLVDASQMLSGWEASRLAESGALRFGFEAERPARPWLSPLAPEGWEALLRGGSALLLDAVFEDPGRASQRASLSRFVEAEWAQAKARAESEAIYAAAAEPKAPSAGRGRL